MNSTGIIYVLTNEYMPGLVKIGMVYKSDLETRLRTLYNTSVPAQFVCEFACRVPVDKVREMESFLHDKMYKSVRVNPSREFFKTTPVEVISTLQSICSFSDFEVITNTVNEHLTDEVHKQCARRPNLDFHKIGLEDGTVLVFEDKKTTCTVAGARRVNYNGASGVSLSRVTKELIGLGVRPAPHWFLEDGTCLGSLYDEYYG